MSFINNTLPTIAITADEGLNNNGVDNIQEVATDVEDMYFNTEKRKKKSKKHTIKKDAYATDIEDVEGSDEEFVAPLIKHSNPISLNDLMVEEEIPLVEEIYRSDKKKPIKKPKLTSQASVSSSLHFLQPDEIESFQILTDQEDFEGSDYEENEESNKDFLDTDLLEEIIHDTGSISISDSVKKFLQAVPSPMITPVEDLSDIDDFKLNKNSKLFLTEKKTGAHYISPSSISPHLSDITDTEIIHYDSNDEIIRCKQKHKYNNRGRRHTLPQKIKLDTTDSDDMDLSENEIANKRRITVSDISKTSVQKLKSQTIYKKNPPQEMNSKFYDISNTVHESESDEETNSVLYPVNNNSIKKKPKIFLKVRKDSNEGLTDTEFIEGDNTIDEEYFYEGNSINISTEFESNNGIVQEKMSVKESKDLNKLAEIRIKRKEDRKSLEGNETDEEEETSECEENDDLVDNPKEFEIAFINMSKVNKNIEKKKFNKSKLCIPTNTNTEVLTDTENLNSSSDDSEYDKPIPVSVIGNVVIRQDTDTESIQSESEYKCCENLVPETYMPSVSRKLIKETETAGNVSKISTTTLNDDSDSFETEISNIKTDIEEFSGDEMNEENFTDKFALDIDFNDGSKTDYKDILRVPANQNISECETDTEDINSLKKPKSAKTANSLLCVLNDDVDKLTDTEDLELSDKENVKNYNFLEIVTIDNKTNSKTDTEDFDASDNDQEKTNTDYCRTPDILRQMEGQTICSQDGDGYFSLRDIENLNNKHKIMGITEGSPSPTFTDEIITSADEENYSRAETATPLQMTEELNETVSNKVHSQSTKKINLETDDEVMYLKGGGFFPDAITDTEEMGISDEESVIHNDISSIKLISKLKLNINKNKETNKPNVANNTAYNQISFSWKEEFNQEWSPAAKGTSTAGEKGGDEPVGDAAHQDTRAARLGYNAGNQRTFGASCSKPESSSSSYFTSTHVIPSNTQISSYTQLDQILDHMLAEVDEQEKLVELDASQKTLSPICVNSFKLVPTTDAIIELSISQTQNTPKLFETTHEIIINDHVGQNSNDMFDLDDDISLKTLNKSQDTDSLFSFESISEIYFLENMSNKYKASCESLGELDMNNTLSEKIIDDEHIYEIIEPKIDLNSLVQDDKQEIWWEGTYRDLSIVPEEDEDDTSEINELHNYIPDNIYEMNNTFSKENLNETRKVHDDCDNVSHCSSSEFSQITGDEYDTSDVENKFNKLSNIPVKAEVKLLVKTSDRGKENIEIRSVKEYTEQINCDFNNKNNFESITRSHQKPTYTLQRLFVRGSDNTSVYKEFPKQYPDQLKVTSNAQYPLQYNTSETNTQNLQKSKKNQVDLFANSPFYPCYETYDTQNCSSNSFPTAYCDWLLQPDDDIGGKTTSPSILVRNEVTIVTGESLIHDTMSKDLSPIINETKSLIKIESETDNDNACVKTNVPSQLTVTSTDPEKAMKEFDNKKEKSKSKGGFFSSLKSLVGRSFDSSDSETKEEKTPKKKKKKDKSTSKKNKEEKILKAEIVEIKPTQKSPVFEEKPHALYESNEIDNIPPIDEIEGNNMQVTDLDAEVCLNEDIKNKAKTIVNTVITDSEKAASNILSDKIQEFNLEGTVTPEEVRRSTEPIIINEDEFLVVIEPKLNNDYEDIQCRDDIINETSLTAKLADISETNSDTLKSRKSTGFLKLFGKKDSRESDEETRTEEEKQDYTEHRKSTGFFGIFSKKPKEEEKKEETKNIILKEEPGMHYSTVKREFSKEVQQQMVDTAHFLMTEVEHFEDAKLDYSEIKKLEQMSLSKEVQQHMVESAHFLRTEIELFEDVRPQKVTKKVQKEIPCKEKTIDDSEKAQNLCLSAEVQQQMLDTSHFLLKEIELFDDVKKRKQQTESQKKLQSIQNEKDILNASNEAEYKISKTTNEKIVELPHVFMQLEKINEMKVENKTKEPPKIQSKNNIQDNEIGESKSHGFFSKLGFGGKVTEKKDESKEKKKHKRKKEKKPGFFSKIGEKFSSGSEDKTCLSSEDELKLSENEDAPVSKVKISNTVEVTLDEKKSIKQLKDTLTNTEDMNECKISFKKDNAPDFKESSVLFKDLEKEKLKESIAIKDKFVDMKQDIQEAMKESTDNLVSFEENVKDFTQNAEKKLIESKELVKNITQSTVQKASEISTDAKQKTECFNHDIIDDIRTSKDKGKEKVKATLQYEKDVTQISTEKAKDSVQDIPETIILPNDAANNKIQALQSATEDIKEGLKKDEGFFSGLGKIFNGSANDAKQDFAKTAIISQEKLAESTTTVENFAQGTLENTLEYTNDVKQTLDYAVDDIKDEVKSSNYPIEKIDEILTSAKEETTKSTEHVNNFVQDDFASVKSSKDATSFKLKENVRNKTEDIKDGAKKTEEIVAEINEKIKSSICSAQEDIVTTVTLSKEQIDVSKEDVKETAQNTVKKLMEISCTAEQKTKNAADDIKKKVILSKDTGTETVRKMLDSANKETEASTEKVKNLVQDATESILPSKDAATTHAKESLENLKENLRDGSKKADGYFSALAENVEGSVKETQKDLETTAALSKAKLDESKEHIKETAQSTKEKASEITSAAQIKTKNVLDDIEDGIKSSKDKSTEHVKETIDTAKEVTQASTEKVEAIVQDASERVKLSKDETTTKAQETITNIKADVKDGSKKAEGFFSGLGKKIKGSVKGAQEDLKTTAAISKEKVDKSKEHVKDIAQRTVEKMSDVSSAAKQKTKVIADDIDKELKTSKEKSEDKIKESLESAKEITQASTEKVKNLVQDATESIVSSKDAATTQAKESLENLKENLKDGSKKPEGFLSELAEKVEGSVKETQKDLETTAAFSKAKLDESKEHIKETAQSTKEKASEITSAAQIKTKNVRDDIVDGIKSTKDKSTEQVNETIDTAKKVTQASTEKVKDIVQDASERVKLSKDETTTEAQETITNIKADVKDGSKKAEGFFSGLGKKIKGSVKDAREDLKTTAAISKEKVDKSKEHVKDIAQNTVEKMSDVSSAAKQKTKVIADDIDKELKISKEKSAEKIKESLESAKKITQASTEKVKDLVQDATESIVSSKDAATTHAKESLENLKENLRDGSKKTEGYFSALAENVEGSVKETQKDLETTAALSKAKLDESKEHIKETAQSTKEKASEITSAAQIKTKNVRDDIEDGIKSTKDKSTEQVKETIDTAKKVTQASTEKVKDIVQDASERVKLSKDETTTKAQETITNIKEDVKDGSKKAEGFFSGLGKKIKGSVKDAREDLKTTAAISKEKVDKSKEHVKDIAQSTVEKMSDVSSAAKQKTKVIADDIDKELKTSKEKSAEKIKESLESAKKITQASTEKVKDLVQDATESIVSSKDATTTHAKESLENLKENLRDGSKKPEGFFSGLTEKVEGSVKETQKDLETTAALSKAKLDESKEHIKETAQSTKEKASEITSAAQIKTKNVLDDIEDGIKSSKDKSTEHVKETIDTAKEVTQASTEKVKAIVQDASERVKLSKDETTTKAQETITNIKADVKDGSMKAEGFFSGLGKKIKGSVKGAQNDLKTTAAISKEKVDESQEHVKDIAQSTVEKMSDVSSAAKQKTKVVADDIEKEFKTSIEKSAEKVKESLESAKEATQVSTEKVKDFVEFPTERVISSEDTETAKTKELFTDIKENVKDGSKNTEGFLSGLGKKFKGSVEDVQEDLNATTFVNKENLEESKELVEDIAEGKVKKNNNTQKVCEDIEDALHIAKERTFESKDFATKITESDEKIIKTDVDDKSFIDTKNEFICFVTTPTMQRKGIGGSQRLTKYDRPALMDVSNMPVDSSSDEDEYIVTEPGEKQIDGNISSCGSSIVIETIQENEEEDIDKKNEITLNTLDAKKRPLFHIGSKDDESYSESVDLGDQIESECMQTKRESESESTVNNDALKSDIDIIENKLLLLGKALDDLEQVNNDLEPLESFTDDKNERKLRRVERRFERMASETMEKDSTDAKEKQMTSPEIEAKRENDFRTIVSQLSQEEVSECQKIYSSLWDDATFTPSEEWDSKTPDSQPDDIQELPPGEVVYMAPVTLNKDHLINKAGIEVDVIPIKRSPCTSPLPKRKLQNKGRAKSAMGFYKEKQFEERGSLPDLQNTGKINDKKLNIQKGSIMSAILKSNPNILKDSVSSINSTNSEYFNLGNDKSLTRRQSTESFIKGSIVTAVKEWMEKSTPFGSTDNVRSTDAISLADTNISIFDDDDNDSVDLQSDSVYQMETESSKSDNYIPDIFVSNENFVPSNLYDSFQYVNKNQTGNDFGIPTTSITRKVFSALDQFSVGETSGGPLTKLTSEASSHLATNLKQPVELTPIPKPKPRTDKTPEANKVVTSAFTSENLETNVPETSEILEETPESYSDRKKFWENVSASKKEEEKYEISVKKRMSLFEDQTNKQDQESVCIKKRTSVHEINVIPPVPKPRSTIYQNSSEESNNENQLHEIKEDIEKHKEVFVSEYKAAFKDPSLVVDQPIRAESLEDENSVVSTMEQKTISGKSESIDSEHEYLKYEHQAYENPGYISESDQETDQSIKDEELDSVPIIKRRQMSISQPPVAATRKTIFERSASLPTENLQDVCEKSVKARKQYFEQQIKNEMVIDQLMTQLEEEEPQEYKTLTDATECKTKTPEEKIKIETVVSNAPETEKEIEKDLKDVEKKMSPISSSSSQDTRTEDDITQYTPTSVKDLAKYFQPNLINDFITGTKSQNEIISKTKENTKELQFSAMETENISKITYTQETDSKAFMNENEPLQQMQQPSSDSEQSISSERSIELGSVDELPTQIAEVLQYKSDSISKPSDSLEVHVDKSEIEDSEKVTDATDIENKSLSAEEYLSDIMDQESKVTDKIDSVNEILMSNEKLNEQLISPLKEHKEQIVDTTWEVSIESQPLTEITESVVEIPIERQIIVEKDEELSSSVRDESDLGSEIHQDHSESNESERIKSEHSEVEQLILESLYHQKINPEDARKIASELVDDIETEIERRNLIENNQLDDFEPPAPPAEVAKNQISDYLRQLAEAKGLDAKEVELVETVLARKQNELSKLSRHDTQTSSMEITDEDLKYSGADYDISPSESHENILEEQIEQLEFESQYSDKNEKSIEDEVKYSEKSSDSTFKDIHAQQDRKFYDENQTLVSVKTETIGTVSNISDEQKDILKKSEQILDENILMEKKSENILDLKQVQEKINLSTDIEIATDSKTYQEKISTDVTDNEHKEHKEKNSSTKTVTDMIESEEKIVDKFDKQTICIQGTKDAEIITHEETKESIVDTKKFEITKAIGDLNEEKQSKLDHKHEILTADDGSQVISEEIREEVLFKTVSKSHIIDHKREEKTSISYIQEEPGINLSDESKSSTYESAKSPGEQVSSSSSLRKDDTDTSNILEKPEVIFRKKIRKDLDTSSSSGNLKIDNRKSGADFEAYSSSGESHYHSFDQDSARSRPCSSDVEGLLAAGSSEYESALTSQDISSKSHITSTEYHTAISSISSQSMKSLDSESSGHLGSIEVSEASETLVASEVPSNFDLEGDILDGAMSQLLEDEVADSGANEIIEPYDREIPEHVIRGEYTIQDKKSSFDTISDSDIHGESMDISEEDSPHEKNLPGEITGKMKRSQEMTFQPVPKAIIPDSPQSDALEMDERFGTSLEDGSVLSMSLSSQSDATALRTVIEQSRRDSERLDGSMTTSGHDSISASNISLDNIIPPLSSAVDTSTSTGTHGQETLSSVTLTTSTIDENGTQSVSTQVTSKSTVQQDDVHNGPTQVDYVPEYDDVIEPKKIRGHRRQESTSFAPSMIPGFLPRTDIFKATESTISATEKHVGEMTLKEVYHEETKDVDETEESYETEADQGYYRQQKESGTLDTESDQDADKDDNESRPHSRISKTDSEIERGMSAAISEDKPDSELVALMNEGSVDIVSEPIERPLTPEPPLDSRGSIDGIPSLPTTPKSKICGSEKSIEEGEAEAAFSMVAHVSPAHKAKGDICPIIEDEDAEKHELETREKAQKEMERKRAQILKDQSPGNIPDIMVTEHMTPLVDREFHYPDLELEEKEALAKSAPQTPASVSSKSSEETDQGREYVLDDSHQVIPEEPELEINTEDKQMTESKSEITQSTTIDERTIYESNAKEPGSLADSPNSDSFEILEKPDIIDDFVVIEEVAKEAAEHDMEGKSVKIKQTKYIRKHDEEVEEYLVKSAPTPLTRMTELKYYPDGASSGDELGPFDFEDSPPQAGKKSSTIKTKTDPNAAQSYGMEYDRELEASKKWIEMQFQGDQAAMISAGYGYEMEFERGPLEDIKEEEATDFESSRIGSLDSQKQSIGSLGSVKDSFSSTPEYDVLAGRKFFTRSGEHDDISMSSLQEFEHLERVISLENRRHHQGSQDSSSNGSFSKRYHASRSGQGDDVSMSSLKEFEGLETACIEAHIIEVKAKEEEALLTQIDEAQESLISESESCKSLSSVDKKNLPESEEEDYEKRMFEIDEIIKQAQSNVEKFIDMKELADKTESMGRGDSLEEVAKVPDLELDEPLVKSTVHTVKWGTDDIMQTSTDSLEEKPEHRTSIDSLDMKTTAADIMTTSTDSIEYHIQSKSTKNNLMTDSIEIPDQDRSCMITSDSLELTPGALTQLAHMSDSIDEDGSRIGTIAHDQSSSSGFSMGKDEQDIQDQRAEYLLGSTDSLEPSSSTATHATYQYETDSVMSGSFTSGGSNTMVSSTDTIDPLTGQAHGVDLASAVRKVWFDEHAFEAGTHFTTELLDDGSRPYVTEVIEPCEGDAEYSHTIHRKVQLPPEIKKITFKGPDADLQLRQYIENFGEGEDVQETQETDKDGNIHVKRVVQKRFIVKSDPNGEEKRISGPELESYLQEVSQTGHEYDLSYRDPSECGLTKTTLTDHDGTKTIYGQKFTTNYFEGQTEESALKELLSSIASDVTQSSLQSEQNLLRHIDNETEQPTGQSSATFSGATAANILRAQGCRRKPLRFDISVDDQTEVDPREHDWRFILPRHDEATTEEKSETNESSQVTSQQRGVADQHQLSSEMKELLEEMEKQSKQ